MKINELLVESQIQEGPFTQAIGRGAGKLARGIANIGQDLKTGFKSGYDDKTAAAKKPAAKTGVQPNLTKATGMGIAQGAAKALRVKDPTKDPAAPVKAPTAAGTASASATPDASAASQQSKVGVGQINKIIPSLRTRDLESLKKTVDNAIALKQQQAAAKSTKTAAPADDSRVDASGQPNPKNLQGKPWTEKERAAHQAAGGKFHGVTGDMLPLEPKAKPAAAKPAAEPDGRIEPTMEPEVGTGQAAVQAAKAGQDPEAAAKAAMAAKNPKLGKMMAQAGETTPKKTKKKPTQAQIDADRERLIPATGESIDRWHKQLAESLKRYTS